MVHHSLLLSKNADITSHSNTLLLIEREMRFQVLSPPYPILGCIPYYITLHCSLQYLFLFVGCAFLSWHIPIRTLALGVHVGVWLPLVLLAWQPFMPTLFAAIAPPGVPGASHTKGLADMPGACQQGPYGHGLAVPYRKTAPRKGIDWQGRSRPASEASTPHSSPALKGEASCAGLWPPSRQSLLSCRVKVTMKRSPS